MAAQQAIQYESSLSPPASGAQTVSEHADFSVEVEEIGDGVFTVTRSVTVFTGQRKIEQQVGGTLEKQITVEEETVSQSHMHMPIDHRLPAPPLEATLPGAVPVPDIDHFLSDTPQLIDSVQEEAHRHGGARPVRPPEPRRWFDTGQLPRTGTGSGVGGMPRAVPHRRYEEAAGVAALPDSAGYDPQFSALPSPRPGNDDPVSPPSPDIPSGRDVVNPAGERSRVDGQTVLRETYDTRGEGDISSRILLRQPEGLDAGSATALDVVETLAERGEVDLSVVEQPYRLGDTWVDAVQIGQVPGMDLEYIETYVGSDAGESEIMQTTLDRYEMEDNEFVEIRESYSHGHGAAERPSGEELAAIQAAWDDEYRWFDDWQERSAYALFADARQSDGSVVKAGAPYDAADVPAARDAYIDEFGVAPEDDLPDVVYGRDRADPVRRAEPLPAA